MATSKYLHCARCGTTPLKVNLLDLLLARWRGKNQYCSVCGSKGEFRLSFEFGLNATDSEFTVLDSFFPRELETWHDTDGSKVEFYPSLVILKRHGRDITVWMPYWHVVYRQTKAVKKYGQWAPCMDSPLFEDLIGQARAKGYLVS